jgi:hypothetical protein
MTLPPLLQSSSQRFGSHILETMLPQDADLEINVSKQRRSMTESLLTLGNGGDQPLHAATGIESRHSFTGTVDGREASADWSNITNEGIRPESRDQPLICSICTEEMCITQDIRVLPCKHLYHRYCIDPWLLYFGGNCPLW